MRRAKILIWALILITLPAFASKEGDVKDIRKVMDDQVQAWNRGDIDEFMKGYLDDSQTTMIGKTLTQGYSTILDHYKKTYANKEAMGTLEFSDVEVRSLSPGTAIVTGKFHLTRTAAGGGESSGIFSLVWDKPHPGAPWKIVLDHSTVTTP